MFSYFSTVLANIYIVQKAFIIRQLTFYCHQIKKKIKRSKTYYENNTIISIQNRN